MTLYTKVERVDAARRFLIELDSGYALARQMLETEYSRRRKNAVNRLRRLEAE